MARLTRLSRPPFIQGNLELNCWLTQVHDAINDLPNFSIVSTTDGPESNQTADPGTLLIDVGSATTTTWIKQSGSGSTGWVELDNYDRFQAKHAGLHKDELTPEMTLADADYRTLLWSDPMITHHMSSSTTAGTLTSDHTGTYAFAFQSSFTGANNMKYYAYFHKNGVKSDLGCHTIGSSIGEGSFSIAPSFFTAVPGDTFSVRLRSATTNRVFTNVDGQFSAWKVHEDEGL